ncbi:MAG TPA: phospholipid carrier-dependent glycosyltransferase [Bryobacteraceae bacterium]|nr:phospholipid carrier-dependent glycosyltransferase [Bryobacteraceae bacterium]
MARSLAQTGHIQMDGWSRAIALPQAIWGALAIKLAGFSFMAVRASMIPIVLGCGALTYAIAKWLGLSPWLAGLTAAELLLCPLFVPLSTTFMSEVPSLLFVLMTLYCVLRAVEAPPRSAAKWIALAAVAGFLGGADRQIMWVAPLVMLSGLIALRRRERDVALFALIAMAAVMLAAAYAEIWASRHGILGVPATLPSPAEIADHTLNALVRALLSMSLYCLPALLFVFGSRIAWTRRALLACGVGACLLIGILAMYPDLTKAPWLGNIVTVFGVMRPGQRLVGLQPVALHRIITHGVGVAVIAFTLFAVFALPAVGRALRERGSVDNRLRIFGVVAFSFCAVYFAGSLVSALWPAWYFDRYLLPMIPILNLGAMAVAARLPGTAIRFAAVPILLIFGAYGLVITHDAFRLDEARARAGVRLGEMGVPRTCVTGGYEYDGWTQLGTTGQIGQAGNPNVVFEVLSAPEANSVGKFWFRPLTPSVRPGYFMVTSPQPDLSQTIFTEPYRTWLPPTNREIMVQANSPARCD